jgi:hypothetical protein
VAWCQRRFLDKNLTRLSDFISSISPFLKLLVATADFMSEVRPAMKTVAFGFLPGHYTDERSQTGESSFGERICGTKGIPI